MNGSIWNKWDLHVHAPGTLKNDQYRNTDLDNFCDEIAKSDLAAVGITDYFSIDLAFHVKELLTKRNSSIQVFPNMELRDSRQPASTRLNFHILFSNLLERKEIIAALNRIPVDSPNGKAFLGNISDDQRKSAIADIKQVSEILSESFEGSKPYIILTASGNDGYRPKGKIKDWSPMATTEANVIIRHSDAVFGNAKDALYWNKPSDFDRIPRPVFCGSDAHDLTALTSSFSSERSTWIKGEVTFRGLQETLIEPTSRVAIQRFSPENKDGSRVISSIQLKTRNQQGRKSFSQTLELNPGLNAIIGSRSSGKSILAASIAYACSPSNSTNAQIRVLQNSPNTPSARAIEKGVGPANGWPWSDFLAENEIEIKWGDGKTSTPDEPHGFVTYLPQGYLNSLAEDTSEIQKLLLQSLEVRTNNPTQGFYAKFKDKKEAFRENTIQLITDIFKIIEDRNTVRESLTRLGELERLQERQEELQAKYNQLAGTNLSDSDKPLLEEFNQATRVLTDWSNLDFAGIRQDYSEALNEMSRPKMPADIELALGDLLNSEWTVLVSQFGERAVHLLKSYEQAENLAHSMVSSIQETTKASLEKANNGVLPSSQSAEARRNLTLLNQAKDEIAEHGRLHERSKELDDALGRNMQKVVENRVSYFAEVSSALSDFEELATHVGDVVIGIDFGLDISEAPNTNIALRNKECDVWGQFIEYLDQSQLGSNQGFEEFPSLFDAILTGQIKLKQNRESDRIELAKEIASYVPGPQLFGIYDRDRFGGYKPSTMSAGKRAMAGLSLLLNREDVQGPLIIDQPEDDLDSRSITREIVPFLRNTKSKRQVIMVSHNANLVVGSDSELIVIANQGSKDYKNPGGLRFYYGAGSLESTQRKQDSSFFGKKTVKSHICDLLDGGTTAFEKRARRYR